MPNAENAVLPRRNNLGGYLGVLGAAILAVLGGLVALRRRRAPAVATPQGPEPTAPEPETKTEPDDER